MTSVTIPSSTGALHGGYSSVREDIPDSEGSFESPRTVKRCLGTPTADSCKKRRKQSTPIRISTDFDQPVSNNAEGKVGFSTDPDLNCAMCQIMFDTVEQLQNHISCEHPVECKREPEDFNETSSTPFIERSETPLSLTVRPDIPWMGEVQTKDWMNPNIPNISFNPANPVFMAMTQFSQPDSLPIKPIRIFNPDAYCDLCNKEFCNKYFLKTHKANKHGIYTDIPTSELMPNSVNIPSFTGNMKLPTSVPSVDLSIKNEPKTSASIINSYSDVFPNPFSNKFSRQTMLPDVEPNDNVSASIPTCNGPLSSSESEKLMIEEQTAEDCSNPSITQTESTSLKNDPDGTFYDSIKMSPGQTSREMDLSQRYRRIGVMNPKAFCEICCKEYCNKYFLRTHKMKRHGIYIPDDKDGKFDGMTGFPWPASVQTSPLNLIMTEQSTVHDRKTTSPNDIRCDICGIKFQNASLAQLHNFTVHGKMYNKDQDQQDNSTEDPNKKSPEPIKPSEKSLNPEAISEDLQKLQTMILQLNDLDVSKVSTCSTCNKEFENKFYLHAHMVTEHGFLPDDVSDVDKTADSESSNNNTLCDLCGKDVQNSEEMKKHIIEAHSGMNSNGDSNKEEYSELSTPEKMVNRQFGTNSAISERRFSVNVTPTSSYCEICNKELCNKYFMKTHMQRMHGIEIENGSQIGGVVCDICNKELCSKYFLRVHKHNTHGIVEYGTSLLQPRKSEGEPPPPPVVLPPEPDPPLKAGDLADLSHRYFTHFTEVCPICSRRFRSTKWLKAHLVSDHGQVGVEKWNELEQQLQQNFGPNHKPSTTTIKSERTSPSLKIPNGGQESPAKKVGIQNVLSSLFGVDDVNAKTYQCSYCPFTSPLLPLLFIHERSHSVSANNGENFPIKCPVCPQSFLQRELFQSHLYSNHPFLPLPPLFNGNTNHSEMSRESQENIEEPDTVEGRGDHDSTLSLEPGVGKTSQIQAKNKKQPVLKPKVPTELSQSLKEVAKKTQMPATYAVPQGPNWNQEQGEETAASGYVMQAFLLEESAPERRVAPSVVFLPMLQKQPAPLTVTFTLTPA